MSPQPVAETIDAFHRGRFHLVQPHGRGHRAGMDAMLLASLVMQDGAFRVADLGAGAGAAGFAVASRLPDAEVVLVERSPDMAEFARKSLALAENAPFSSRIAVLETRRAEYEDWLSRRNEFMKQAEGQLIEIYKKMAPDAAAPQLEETNVILAAAIIMKLPPRQSSLILTEMQPDKAAKVAAIMSSAGDSTTSKDPS